MFIVMEIQQTEGGAVSTLVTTHTTLAEANSKYHDVLKYAAVSALPVHTCVIMNPYGNVIKAEAYTHRAQTD